MYQGLLEGSPISIIAIALLLSRVISQALQNLIFRAKFAKLEADDLQEGHTFEPMGWIDDWLLAANSLEDLADLLDIWEKAFSVANWQIQWTKTEVISNVDLHKSFAWEGHNVCIKSELTYLGCVLSSDGRAREHLEFRGSRFMGAWHVLQRQF